MRAGGRGVGRRREKEEEEEEGERGKGGKKLNEAISLREDGRRRGSATAAAGTE